MEQNYSARYSAQLSVIEDYLRQQVVDGLALSGPLHTLKESMAYSLQNGGKRFRPLLSVLISEMLAKPPDFILPFAAAVEMIHTYSLIHDDLPCMDNDSERRGQPTNHVVFGETLSLLAGDALQSWAFEIVLKQQEGGPLAVRQALATLAKAIGAHGMVAGQVMDMKTAKTAGLDELEQTHHLKTGALITAAVVGSAQLCEASQDELINLERYARLLGLSFQVADDILDADQASDKDSASFLRLLTLSQAKDYLAAKTTEAKQCLLAWGPHAENLKWIADYNTSRLK